MLFPFFSKNVFCWTVRSTLKPWPQRSAAVLCHLSSEQHLRMAHSSATCTAKGLQKSCTLRLGSTRSASTKLQLLQHTSFSLEDYISKENIKFPSNTDFPTFVYAWTIPLPPQPPPYQILWVKSYFKENPQRNQIQTSHALLESSTSLPFCNANPLSWSLTPLFLCVMQAVALLIPANSFLFTLETVPLTQSSEEFEV